MALTSTAAPAQTTGGDSEPVSRPWMLGISGVIDDLGADSAYATFNWNVTENTWLYFSGGTSHFESGAAKLTTNSFLAGFDRLFGRFGFSLDAEAWGDSAQVESTDIRMTGHFGGERYRIYLELQDRDIDLSGLLQDRVNLQVAGTGIGGRVRVNLTERWRLYLRAMSYDYEWASAAFASQASLTELCDNAAALIDSCSRIRTFLNLLERRNSYIQSTLANNSFLDSELTLSLEWVVGNKLVNLNLAKDRAIDRARSESRSVGASVLFPVNYRMDLELSLGRSDSEIFQSSTYGGVFFVLYGG